MTPATTSLLLQIQRPAGAWLDVGYLHNRNSSNWFDLTDSYWLAPERPVLGQVFEESGRKWKPHTSTALPRWFSHLLPEGRLREAVANAANVRSGREFELIRRLGSTDLPGAVRAIELEGGVGTPMLPQGSEVGESGENEDPLLKFSLAGAQLKFSVFGDERGLTVPTSGQAGNFIVKFPDGRPGFDAVPEVEWASLHLARAAGIDTPKADLIDPKDVAGLEEWATVANGSALAVERFDRKGRDGRVHMEELAQVLNIPTTRARAKYLNANFETVAVFVGALAGVAAVGEVIDRIVLNIIVGNGDAHLKNWAFLYPDGRQPQLSPVYDVLPTVLYIAGDNIGLNLDGTKSFEDVTPASFEGLGARSGYGAVEARVRASEAVERVMLAWPTLRGLMPSQALLRLTERLGSLALVSGRP